MRRSVSVQTVGIVAVTCIRLITFTQRRKVKELSRKEKLCVFASTWRLCVKPQLVTKQAIHVLLRIEDHEVVDFLTNPGITDREV